MARVKLNCWEAKRCGREPGGARADELGACPAATAANCDGINAGTNAGRLCWAVTATHCGGQAEDPLAEKLSRCEDCSFFRRVKCEEGPHFQLLRPGLGTSNPAELHRLLNSVVSMLSVTRDILGMLAEGPLLRHIAAHALAATASSAASVYLFSEAGDELLLAARAGTLERPERVALDARCAVAEAARTKRFAAASDGSASIAAVPIGGRESLAGVLELAKDGSFSTDDQWFLHEFALIAALGIANARLVDDLRQLRRFDKAKSRFVSLLMHHINSPLATVSCSLQAISKLGEKLSQEDRAELIGVSMDRVASIQDLSRRLLDLAAIRSGSALGHLAPVSIADALRHEVENRLARARELGLDLVLDNQAGDPLVRADADGLRVIFANLLDNAMKYTTGEVRKVTATLTTEHGRVRAEVRDTGIGIPLKDQASVFEEFHRAGNVASARAHGHGLGLAVVRELVDRYGGQVELESEVGVGTTIAVVFPLLPASEP